MSKESGGWGGKKKKDPVNTSWENKTYLYVKY